MTDLNEHHVRLLRAAAVVWAPVESGAPAVLYSPRLLEEEDGVPYADVAARAGLEIGSPPSEAQKRDVEALLAGLPAAFVRFMELGRLEPGRYSYRNPLVGLPHSDYLVPSDRPGLARQALVEFELTPELAKLLRHARWEAGSGGWLGLNPKRPYGDMTYFELDMAEILGEPRVQDAAGHLSPDLEARLGGLHEDMQGALQVFLQNARLEP